MLLFDGRGVAYSYESTVPAPLLPSSDRSYNLPRSYKAPPQRRDANQAYPLSNLHWEVATLVAEIWEALIGCLSLF